MEFGRPITLSVLTERRALGPNGLDGGLNAVAGRDLLVRKKDGSNVLNIGRPRRWAKSWGQGNSLVLLTPGGGGFGKPLSAS